MENMLQNQLSETQDQSSVINGDDLKNLPYPKVSKASVKKAGKLLGNDIVYDGNVSTEVIQAFSIAHDWRASHTYPMHIERLRLSRMAQEFSGNVSASRLKRMASIRKKLGRIPVTLDRFQDLGGCRVILDSMTDVRSFRSKFENAHSHRIKKTDDYILEPKRGGYRSVHLIVNPECKGDRSIHNNQRLEVQLRTRLQHVWATAGEAIGAMRNEDIKAGEGCSNWLRLLHLMSAEFSELEGEPIGRHISTDRASRLKELVELEKKLSAVASLKTYSTAVNYQQNANWQKTQYFVIVLNTNEGTISVRPQMSFSASQFDGHGDTTESIQTALVSVDRVEDLVTAYPNFFLDVEEFLNYLKSFTGKTQSKPTKMQGRSAKAKSAIDKLDLSFLKR